jgi:hypothetical protein|nr:MAG TPA: hypothetical protein [Caudoviricetes sp.]
MNPIKDFIALKPAESLTVDIKFRDGCIRKLTAHRPDESLFIQFHLDTTPALLLNALHGGQRHGFKGVANPNIKTLPMYITAAVFSAMVVSGVEGEEAEEILLGWRRTCIREMLKTPDSLLEVLVRMFGARNGEK